MADSADLSRARNASPSTIDSTAASIPEAPAPTAVDMPEEVHNSPSAEVESTATSPRTRTSERRPAADVVTPDLTPRSSDAVAAILREVQEQEALLQWLRERAKEKGLDPAMAALAEKTVAHVQSLMGKLAQVDPRMAGSGSARLTTPSQVKTQDESAATPRVQPAGCLLYTSDAADE